MNTAPQQSDHLPLTSTTTGTPERRFLGALTLAAGLALTLGACGSLAEGLAERDAGHTKALEYATGAEGKKADALADWVPDDAQDVRVVFRTTGDERIVTMTADLEALPGTCTEVTAASPLTPRPERASLSADDYRTEATLTATWWTPGQEQEATVQCGKWWVGESGDKVFAFTPELTMVEIEEQPTARG